jgi:hypothetical protein
MFIHKWKLIALTLTMALGCIFLMGQTGSNVQTPRSTPYQPAGPQQTGRFQIVNGTPGLPQNVMMLDTWTGQSWLTCEDTKVTSKPAASTRLPDGLVPPATVTTKIIAWCPIPMLSSPSGQSTEP